MYKGYALVIKIISVTFVMFFITLKVLFSQTAAMNAEITSLIRPNWEFESFWAIPRIGETKPLISITISGGNSAINVRCLDLEYLEIKKTFKPKAKLEREFLHKIMCKSIKRALKNTQGLSQLVQRTGLLEVGLRFDFQNGWIQFEKIPEPPQPESETNEIGSGLDLHQQNT